MYSAASISIFKTLEVRAGLTHGRNLQNIELLVRSFLSNPSLCLDVHVLDIKLKHDPDAGAEPQENMMVLEIKS